MSRVRDQTPCGVFLAKQLKINGISSKRRRCRPLRSSQDEAVGHRVWLPTGRRLSPETKSTNKRGQVLRIEDSGDNTKCYYLCDVSVYLKSCWRLRTSGWRAAPTNKLLCAVLEIDFQIPAQSRDLTRQDKSAIQVLFTEIIGHQQRGGFDEDKTVTKIIFCSLNSPNVMSSLQIVFCFSQRR